MPRFASYLTSTADILGSSADDGQVFVNLGDSRSNEGFAASEPVFGIDGFLSRPNPPDADGSAEAFYVVSGNRKIVIGTRDQRYAGKVPTIAEGDRAIVTNAACRILLKREGSHVTLYTEDATDGGRSMAIDMSGEDGTITLNCSGSYIRMDKKGITLGTASGKAFLILDDNGISVIGPSFNAACAGGTLGLVPPGVAPPKPLRSILSGPTGVAAAPSTAWTVFP